MSVLKGDYIGFSYGTKADGTPMHSSDLGIVRTSDGSRFNENLLPTMQDKTVQVPGGDGTYYFGSYYTQRQFNVPFAFDSLTEDQVAKLKAHFGDKKVHDLIFDEAPYKVYRAKVTGTATIKYIPFAEGDTNRVYKGEGTIQFTCYNPFARSRFKWLNEYTNDNKEEWSKASGMKTSNAPPEVYKATSYDTYYQYDDGPYGTEYGIVLWNPGDKPADFVLYIPFQTSGENKIIVGDRLRLWNETAYDEEYLEWKQMTRQNESDVYVGINSKLNLIEGYDANFKKTGSIYNEFITVGAFFQIPNSREKDMSVWFRNNQASETVVPTIKYDYVYF